MKVLVVAILSVKALPSGRDSGTDECEPRGLIKMGRVLGGIFSKFVLVVGRDDYHQALHRAG